MAPFGFETSLPGLSADAVRTKDWKPFEGLMKKQIRIIAFRDHIGQFPSGQAFYPESLMLISAALAELRRAEMGEPKYFNANVQFLLDLIIKYFEGIHDTHNAAKAVYQRYRTAGRQYCLYLRSFSLSGILLSVDLAQNNISYGLWARDRDFRELVKNAIRDHIDGLSFVNTLDVYPRDEDRASGGKEDFMIPSFRVLSHNWQDIVREAIRGAKFIVLSLEGETEGVKSEVDMIRECGMAHRTVCVTTSEIRDKHPGSFSDFYDVIEVPGGGPVPLEIPEVQKLRKIIDHLANDVFKQTNQVRDLSDFRCYVVEKRIELAASQFSPEVLAGVDYQDYIPSSLANNWNLFAEDYPKMLQHWGDIDEMISAHRSPDVGQLADVMYEALGAFYMAVTLERYEEMAVSIGTVGLAHRMVTRESDIMTDCYRHAAKCAEWGDDMSLAKFYSAVLAELGKSSPEENP